MVFLGALQLPWRRLARLLFFGFSCVVCICGAGGARALVSCVCLWGSCGWQLWWCVLCVRAGVCLVCRWFVWVPVLASLGLVWRLCVDAGAVCLGPSPTLAVGPRCGSPPALAGVCWWWCVPPPPPLRALPPPSLCPVAWGAVLLVPCPGLPGLWCVCGGAGWGGGEGSLSLLGSLPLVFPLRGSMLALPVRV